MGWVVNATSRPLYLRERKLVHILWEAGWAPRPVEMGTENLALAVIRPLDRPSHTESLYPLSYPGIQLL